MSEIAKNTFSRRTFLQTSLLGVAGFTLLPGFKMSPNNNINLGFIGLGRQSIYLLDSFLNMEGIKVLACSDVYGIKRQRFENKVNKHYADKGEKLKIKSYENYKDLLDRKDIDAVVIATPDHWHGIMAVDACKKGKDIYLEKPLTLTIKEGQELVKAVRKYNRILAVGSQQRSDPNFQYAIKLVQEGKLGKIEKVNAHVGEGPRCFDLPREIVPKDLNWEMWLGPNQYVPYHQRLNPPISLNPEKYEEYWGEWRYFKETGGGFTTDWGAHMFDIAQWGLGMDKNGPVEIIAPGVGDYKFLTYKYANGIIMTQEPFNEGMKGVKFFGSEAWIEVARGHFNASDPKLMPDLQKGAGPYESAYSHQENFIQALRERKDPTVPVEIGHSTCTVCTLGNIAYDLGRSIKWDPIKQQIINDPQAELYLHRVYRPGYSL